MLSASHNPMPDNGIKFFARGGHKLADEVEDAIEARMGEDWRAPDRRRTSAASARSADGADRVRRAPARQRCRTGSTA